MLEAYVRPAPRAVDGPLVTVIIATFNRSEVLRYALGSVLAQNYDNLEVLVVGDACTDDSEEVVRSFGDPRVRWMNLDVNSGSGAGPNQAGLGLASGELVAYLGHDDLWRRHHLALLVADLQRSEADVTYSVCDSVFPGRFGIRRLTCPAPGEHVAPSSLMHRLQTGLRAGGWRDHRTIVKPPDTDFLHRLGQVPVGRAARQLPRPALRRTGAVRGAHAAARIRRRGGARVDRDLSRPVLAARCEDRPSGADGTGWDRRRIPAHPRPELTTPAGRVGGPARRCSRRPILAAVVSARRSSATDAADRARTRRTSRSGRWPRARHRAGRHSRRSA
jgi:glycosyl transferase family 2